MREKLNYILITALIFTSISCKNPTEVSNERIKTLIFKKGSEIRENNTQYKNDIKNSGFLTLLSLERLEKDSNQEESKKIIRKAKYILNIFNQKNKTLVTDLKNLIDSIRPTEKIDQKEIERMKSKFYESIEVPKSNYILDSTALEFSKEILGVLKNCNYQIKDGNPKFESIDCLTEYNSKIIKLNQLKMDARTKRLNDIINSRK